MEEIGKTKWVATAAIAFLMTIQIGEAQTFNYTTALLGWTDTFNPYPSAQVRSPHCSFLWIILGHIGRNVNCCLSMSYRPLCL